MWPLDDVLERGVTLHGDHVTESVLDVILTSVDEAKAVDDRPHDVQLGLGEEREVLSWPSPPVSCHQPACCPNTHSTVHAAVHYTVHRAVQCTIQYARQYVTVQNVVQYAVQYDTQCSTAHNEVQ